MTITAYLFHPLDEWKSALLNLPSFFELMQSIFGNIKTPYNKQKLMEDLCVFLSREDIQKIIASYIDENDRKIIAAVALLGDPPPAELENFFQGDIGLVILRELMLNLEERFILYRFQDEDQGQRRLALNPALKSVLTPLAADKGVLFPFETVDTGGEDAAPGGEGQFSPSSSGNKFPVTDDRIMGAFFAFVSGEEDFFKSEGIRKKIQDQGKKLFPNLDMDMATGVLLSLGLFYAEGDKIYPVSGKIRKFASLSPADRRDYWAAGLYIYLNQKKAEENPQAKGSSSLPGFARNQTSIIAGLIHDFRGFLDSETGSDKKSAGGTGSHARQFPEITVMRFLRLIEKEKSRGVWGLSEKIKYPVFLTVMETAGILKHKVSGKSVVNCREYIPVIDAEREGPAIAMDSEFSFFLYPGISFGEILELAAFSQVREDSPSNFEITRASAVRGFDQGLTAESILDTLNDLSGDRVEEGLAWTLNDWESRYSAVSLYEGLILRLSEERQYLAETGLVASLIKKTLAPGLYLLSCDISRASEILEKAGVDIIARPDSGTSGIPESGSWPETGNFPSLGRSIGAGLVFAHNAGMGFTGAGAGFIDAVKKETMAVDSADDNLKEKLCAKFSGHVYKLKITQSEKDELLNRIERRMILSETQLDKAVIKIRKLEARGLDYTGKTSIARQAIAEGSALEVTWPGPDGINTIAGIPVSLEKKEKESVLVLKTFSDGDSASDVSQASDTSHVSDLLHIPLGKISLLRLVRQSIFRD